MSPNEAESHRPVHAIGRPQPTGSNVSRFGGLADRASAFKLVVYGSTAAWVAGVFQLIPGLGLLALLGLYSLYLYYVGATPVMRVPQDKAAGSARMWLTTRAPSRAS